MMLAIAMVFAGYTAYAESITVSTYYPSPYGSYQKLDTTSDTHLATGSGGLMIGSTANTTSKLEVRGATTLVGNTAVTGNATVTNGLGAASLSATGDVTVGGNLNLKSGGLSGNLQVNCNGTNCYAVYA